MKKRILIIDDDQNILDVMSGYLEVITEYEVSTTVSAKEGLKILENEHFDLLITDILMPELNGLELITKVQEKWPDLKILACSGGGDSGSVVAGLALDQALNEGACNAITKPFTDEQLMTKVQGILK
jgi:DNA-binding NtrC family response regulator